jgi:hypothetical protein
MSRLSNANSTKFFLPSQLARAEFGEVRNNRKGLSLALGREIDELPNNRDGCRGYPRQ